jgi:hypothetical protein
MTADIFNSKNLFMIVLWSSGLRHSVVLYEEVNNVSEEFIIPIIRVEVQLEKTAYY